MFSPLANLLESCGLSRAVRRGWSVFSLRPRRLGLGSERPAVGLAVEGLSAAESLEMRRMMAVNVSLVGNVLTVSFDDASHDFVSLSINATGYEATGANTTSGTGTISQLVVLDAGKNNISDLTLLQADQTLTGGLSISSNVTAARIEDSITTNGGDISIGASCVTTFAAITLDSGSGNQSYAGPVELHGDVVINATTGGNVALSRVWSPFGGTAGLTVNAGTQGAVTFSGYGLEIAGNVSVTARNIEINANLVSTSGDLSPLGYALTETPSAVTFHGVLVNGSCVEVARSIFVSSRGGNAVAAGVPAACVYGVYVQAGSAIAAGGASGSSDNAGVQVNRFGRITAGTLAIGSAASRGLTVSASLASANAMNLALGSGAGVMLTNTIATAGNTITIDDGAGGDTIVVLGEDTVLDTTAGGTVPAGGAITGSDHRLLRRGLPYQRLLIPPPPEAWLSRGSALRTDQRTAAAGLGGRNFSPAPGHRPLTVRPPHSVC